MSAGNGRRSGFASSSTTSPGEAPIRRADEQITRWLKRILHPHLEKHDGLHWEFHADETSEDLWMINGLVPPPGGSEAEKAWATTNVASPY